MKTKVKYKKFAEFPDFETLKDIVLYGFEKGQDKNQYMFYNFDNKVETKTFNQVHHDTIGLGQYLHSKGLKNGKKVAVLSENSYYWVA
ncbi:MAG: long-chain fatty acid--CoA ligase, partial [Clostridia bacterium]|nr:long-chain fatty acid--CoA ligase [Clostridia bacterium]